MNDVLTPFLRRTMDIELPAVRAASDVLYLTPEAPAGPERSGAEPARRIHGLFTSVEYFVAQRGGVLTATRRPLRFALEYPDDYCSCADGSLQLRVARVLQPIAHPNVSPGGVVCLGPTFRPSTGLRALVEHVHSICSGRVYASDSPWDAATADFFRRHPQRVRALRSAPLWREATARRVRVEPLDGAPKVRR